MHFKEIGEAEITFLHRHLCRANNVSEHQGDDAALWDRGYRIASQKGLYVLKVLVCTMVVRQMIRRFDHNELSGWDSLGHVTRRLNRDCTITLRMKDERRYTN